MSIYRTVKKQTVKSLAEGFGIKGLRGKRFLPPFEFSKFSTTVHITFLMRRDKRDLY